MNYLPALAAFAAALAAFLPAFDGIQRGFSSVWFQAS
jgi:hypothetical protein